MGERPFRLGGWADSELLAERLSSHECGCEIARTAYRSEDEQPLLEIAEQQARSWSCPNASHAGETDDPAALAVLDAVAELTDVPRTCLRTCPRWHATQPDVVRATQYRQYVEAGCPDAIEHDPPVALIRAAHVVAGAEVARIRAERKAQEKRNGRHD